MPVDPAVVDPALEVGVALWQQMLGSGAAGGGGALGVGYLVYRRLLAYLDELVETRVKKGVAEALSAQPVCLTNADVMELRGRATAVEQAVALQLKSLDTLSADQQGIRDTLTKRGEADVRHEAELKMLGEKLRDTEARSHDNAKGTGILKEAVGNAQRGIDEANRGVRRILERGAG